MESSMEGPWETKNRVSMWPSNPTHGCMSIENPNLKWYMHSNVRSNIIYKNQFMEATEVHIGRWMDEEDEVHTHTHTHTHNRMLLNDKREWNNVICSDMHGLEIIILGEVCQRETNIIWYCFYVESKNVIQMNLFKKTEIDLQIQITKKIKEENSGEVGER